ncbi:MAG: PAS domain S-box protein, partial [Myxococcota bacterium]
MSGPQPGTPVEMLSWLLDAAEKEWLLAADVQDGRIRGASTAFARLLGHTRATLQGEPLVRVVLSPDTSTLLEHCLAGKKQATVVQLLHAKGPTIPVEAKCHLVHDGDPSAGTLLLAARTLAADGAADGSEQLDRYFDAGLDLHCIADTQGYFRRLSAQWEETLGYSRDELVGARFLDYVHPDDVESTLEAMATLRSQQSVLNFENRYRCRDGTYRWLEWRSLPVGETVYAAARDITRRKRMEQELRDNREQLRQAKHLLESVLDAIPDVIGIQDRHHRMIRYNRAGYELLGIRPEEAAGRLCFELIGRDRPCDECATTAALVTSKPSRAERYLAAAGMWLDCRSYPVVDGGAVEYVVEHLRDVSELKLAEQKLRATEQRLAHVQKMDAIGQLAGGIAHDFNNQLAGVVGSADLLRLELE